MPAPPWSATWSSTKNILPATTWTSTGATAGFAAIGRSPMAAAAGSGTGRPAHRQSAFRLVAVEDLRQPAAQSGPGRPAALAAGQLAAAPGTRRPGIAARPRDHHAAGIVVGAGRCVPQAGGTAVADASAGSGRVVRTAARPDLLTLVFLPYDAFISLDAIGRTLLRLLVTRKRLLEWQTSSDSERTDARRTSPAFMPPCGSRRSSRWRAELSWPSMQPAQLPLALPILGLWLAAPWIAWWISQPIESAGAGFDGGAIDLPATHRAQDLAFF